MYEVTNEFFTDADNTFDIYWCDVQDHLKVKREDSLSQGAIFDEATELETQAGLCRQKFVRRMKEKISWELRDFVQEQAAYVDLLIKDLWS
jgi:hypothetical protein